MLTEIGDELRYVKYRRYVYAHAAAGAFDRATAASTSKQFRSGILILAISSICCLGDLSDFVLVRFGRAFGEIDGAFHENGTGGVFVMKVKVRSEKIVITTGMIRPS